MRMPLIVSFVLLGLLPAWSQPTVEEVLRDFRDQYEELTTGMIFDATAIIYKCGGKEKGEYRYTFEERFDHEGRYLMFSDWTHHRDKSDEEGTPHFAYYINADGLILCAEDGRDNQARVEPRARHFTRPYFMDKATFSISPMLIFHQFHGTPHTLYREVIQSPTFTVLQTNGDDIHIDVKLTPGSTRAIYLFEKADDRWRIKSHTHPGTFGPNIVTTYSYHEGELSHINREWYSYSISNIWDQFLSFFGVMNFTQQLDKSEDVYYTIRPMPEEESVTFADALAKLPPDFRIHVTLDDAPDAREYAKVYTPEELIVDLPKLSPEIETILARHQQWREEMLEKHPDMMTK